jgi:hypothetical protein
VLYRTAYVHYFFGKTACRNVGPVGQMSFPSVGPVGQMSLPTLKRRQWMKTNQPMVMYVILYLPTGHELET